MPNKTYHVASAFASTHVPMAPMMISTELNAVQFRNKPLLAAIDEGSLNAVEILLKESTSDIVNLPYGPLRITALQLAASKGTKGLAILKLLLAHGANVNAADKLGRTALHYASLLGCEEAVKALIKAGAQVDSRYEVSSMTRKTSQDQLDNFSLTDTDSVLKLPLPLPDGWGRTPLHQTVKAGDPTCVELLLQARANPNSRDDRGTTPLLVAGAGVNPDDKDGVGRYEKIVKFLVDAGAHVNVTNADTGTTALHHAVILNSMPAVEILLRSGAIQSTDMSGVTPLHKAASLGNENMVFLLLEAGGSEMVNVTDKVGCTALHCAAYAASRECISLLVQHGGDLSAQTKSNVSVVDAIFSHIPRAMHFILDLLDNSIIPNNASVNDRAFKVRLDFRILCPKGPETQMAVLQALTSGRSNANQMQIMQHPLVESFLQIKWNRLRPFFFILLAVHACFVCSLTVYICQLITQNSCQVAESRHILLFTVIVLLSHTVTQLLIYPRHYVKQYEAWFNLVCILLAFVIAVDGEVNGCLLMINKTNNTNTTTDENIKLTIVPGREWILHFMSIAVFCAWAELMLLMGRFPTWGYYALMFLEVLKNVVKVLMAFMWLVIGFAFSFLIQFHDNVQFSQPWYAFVKTTVMMTGEYEYGDLFQPNSGLHLLVTSRVIFFAFVILATVALMNLMVGMAVSDIQALQAEGLVLRLLKQADFVAHLEKLTTHWMVNMWLVSQWVHKVLDKRRSINTILDVLPSIPSNCTRELGLNLLERIMLVAMRRQQSRKPKEDSLPEVDSQDLKILAATINSMQQDLADIRKMLRMEKFPQMTNRRSKWSNTVTELQQAQGILKMLKRNNTHSAIV